MSTGGSTNVDACTPNSSGAFVVDGDTVVDEVTCLTWMKGSLTTEEIRDAVDDTYPNGTFDDAAASCEALSLGGYDDWRAPSLGEIATIATTCLQWGEPTIPWAPEFDTTGAVWTSTPAGEKYCVLDATAGGTPSSSYSSGPGVRCVRGAGTVTEITECAASAIPSCN